MADDKRLICDAAALEDGGKGVRFSDRALRRAASGVRRSLRRPVYAYVNRCAHVPIELDWVQGEFFDFSGLYLICSTHGATYLPETRLLRRRALQRPPAGAPAGGRDRRPGFSDHSESKEDNYHG